MPQATKPPKRISVKTFVALAVLVVAAGLLTAFTIMPPKGANNASKPAPLEVPADGFPVWTHWADYNDTFLELEDKLGLKEAFATLGGPIANKVQYADVMRRMGTKYRTDSGGEPIGRPGVDYGYKRLLLCTTVNGDPEMICSTKTFFNGALKGITEMRNSWETGFEYAGQVGLYCLSLVQHILPEDKPSSLKYEYNCARPGYDVNTTGSVSIDLTYAD